MNQLVNFYQQNHAVINLLVAIVFYVVAHYKAALSFVKHKASKAMFGVEKASEQLLLSTGQEKMKAVEEMAYQKLPGWVRAVVSPAKFTGIAQKFFDESKMFVEQNAKPIQKVSGQNVSKPSQPQQ